MTFTVHKFSFAAEPGVHEVDVRQTLGCLMAREQHDRVAVWFHTEPGQHTVTRKIAIVETGKPAPDPNTCRYLGSAMFFNGGYVLHVFESQ